MSSRLFKHQMAMTNRPPVQYPQLAVVYTSTPSQSLFDMDNVANTFTRIALPAELDGIINELAYSPDGKFMAVNVTTAPWMLLYRRKGKKFVSVPIPFSYTGAIGRIVFSRDSSLLFVGTGAAAPWLHIYKYNNSTEQYDKLDDANVPAVGAQLDFIVPSPNGDYLAVIAGWPRLRMYKRVANTDNYSNGIAIPNVALPYVMDAAWAPDSNSFAMATDGTGVDCFIAYSRSGDTFSYNVTRTGNYGSNARGVAFSPDGRYVGLTTTSDRTVVFFVRHSSTYFEMATYTSASGGGRITFSPDSKYAAAAYNGGGADAPRFRLFRTDGWPPYVTPAIETTPNSGTGVKCLAFANPAIP